MTASDSKLFQPIRIGDTELGHRVVFAPSGRFRADTDHVPLPHVGEYYEQRASSGGLLFTEGTFPALRMGGETNAPGIWSDEQIAAWKKARSHIYLQLWTLGRAGEPEVLAADNLPYVSASNVAMTGRTVAPRPLTVAELKEYLELYATAASNAVHKAGFDGVEVHSANGYLLNQFLHDKSNTRTDQYGGPLVENRARFPLEVVDAVVKAVGQSKTGVRISPWGTFQDMYMEDPRPTYSYVVTQLRERFPDLAYLHVVEPRADGAQTVENVRTGASNDFIRQIWGSRPFISAGGHTRETALAVAEEKGDMVAFARAFIANPDLPYRLLNDIKLTVGDRAYYYVLGSTDPKGYTDYPFAERVQTEVAVVA
ncbi:NADH:flavin oxidoreductase/NADH oxidase [Mycena amicta]|nr:NADH:flavin oxidoreductase/NADH oxidase [Mycena amicta]